MLLPLQCGGGPDEVEKAYRTLRSAEGVGGSALDDSGIDGLWRRSIALGLAAATSATRRAIYNAFPFLATDLLPHYERTLMLFAAPGATEADRRQAVAALWPAVASAVVRDVEAELRRIDSRFTFELVPEGQTSASFDGRWFGSHDGSELPAFHPTKQHSDLAGPTSRYMATAFLAVADPAALTQADERSYASAQTRLRALLPSWEGFAVSVAPAFLCDESPLDWTVLGDA